MKFLLCLSLLLIFVFSCDLNVENTINTQMTEEVVDISGYEGNSKSLEVLSPENYLFTGINGQPVAKILWRNFASISSKSFQQHFRHEHIWFSDGSNIGFFGDSDISPDGQDFEMYTYSDNDLHYCGGDDYYDEYDVELMKTAIDNITASWNPDYSLFFHNCQHYTDAIHKEYVRLSSLLATEHIKELLSMNDTL